MKNKLKEIQHKYEGLIYDYLKSIFPDYSVNVEFNIDYEMREYFIITVGLYAKFIIECEKYPVITILSNKFNKLIEIDFISKILKTLSNELHYDELMKLANHYYNETNELIKQHEKRF